MRSRIWGVSAAACLALLPGCSRRGAEYPGVDAARAAIRVGQPLEEAQAALREAGLEHSFNERTRTLLGIERRAGGTIHDARQLVVVLDPEGNVESIEIRALRTGP